MATSYSISVSDDGFMPNSIGGVKHGDQFLFTKSGGSVIGVKVHLRYTNSLTPSTEGSKELFGTDILLFSTGAPSQVDKSVQVIVDQPTAFTLELIPPLPSADIEEKPGRGPLPTEKGGVIVVGGSGPVPFPDDPKPGRDTPTKAPGLKPQRERKGA